MKQVSDRLNQNWVRFQALAVTNMKVAVIVDAVSSSET
jgi:hypothetical protein